MPPKKSTKPTRLSAIRKGREKKTTSTPTAPSTTTSAKTTKPERPTSPRDGATADTSSAPTKPAAVLPAAANGSDHAVNLVLTKPEFDQFHNELVVEAYRHRIEGAGTCNMPRCVAIRAKLPKTAAAK